MSEGKDRSREGEEAGRDQSSWEEEGGSQTREKISKRMRANHEKKSRLMTHKSAVVREPHSANIFQQLNVRKRYKQKAK